jgi:putative ABC transport system permease protein
VASRVDRCLPRHADRLTAMPPRLIEAGRRLLALLRRRRFERDLDDELAFHLAMKEAEYTHSGNDAPRQAARRRFGNVARLREELRDMWTFPAVESVWADIRFATRRLMNERSFTLVAVGALALGIGANSTFFALVYAICLRGLPIDAPERVMFVASRDAANRPGGLSYGEFTDLRAASMSFDGLAAMTQAPMVIGDTDRPPERLLGAYISAAAFDVLRETPIAGRTFLPEDDRPGATVVGILAGGVWQSRYAGDMAVVGRTVTVNGQPVAIVGIMPQGFRFPGTADLWLPLATMPGVQSQARDVRSLSVFGRLKEGVTPPLAEAELAAIRTTWTRDFSEPGRPVRTTVVPINEQFNPPVAQRAWLAFITAGVLVLLIACANVANLLLMRGVARAHEMAVRASIGGSRARIVRQLLIEGAVLASFAGAIGIALSHAGLRILSTMLPPDALPYWMTFTLDYRIVAFLTFVSLASVIVFGLAPALQLSKTDPGRVLSDGGRGGTRGAGSRRWMASFLAAECALTLVLLAMVVTVARRDFSAARNEFRVEGTDVLTMWLTFPRERYGTADARAAFYTQLEERLAAFAPGASAALTSALPAGGGAVQEVAVRGSSLPAGQKPPTALTIAVSPRYFDVMRIPVRGEASLTSADRPPVDTAIVNERFARMFVPDREAIGEHVRVGGAADGTWLRIVGVVPTVRQGAGPEPDPVVYLPLRTIAPVTTAIVARWDGNPAALTAPLRELLVDMDRSLPLYRVATLDRAMEAAQWNARMAMAMLRTISVIGAVLALVGLYAVTGHAVGQRRRELAVLAALGARPRQLQSVVLRPAMWQLAAGLGLGVGLTYLFEPLFLGADEPTAMTDVATLVPLIVAVVAVGAVACLIPARQAARADPAVALRAEV